MLENRHISLFRLCRIGVRIALPAAVVLLSAAGTLLCLFGATGALAADAPGAPGGGSNWTTGAKQGLGTSATNASKVWYTLAQGVLTEVYYYPGK